jgi:hypothetical protein
MLAASLQQNSVNATQQADSAQENIPANKFHHN